MYEILFIASSRFLGELVFTTCLLNYILQKHPDACVTVSCGTKFLPLFEGLACKTLIANDRMPYSLHWFKLWGQVGGKSWDYVIDGKGSGISYFLLTKKRTVVKTIKNDVHRIIQLNKLVKSTSLVGPKVWISKKNQEAGEKLIKKSKKKLIGFAPFAGWVCKEWPKAYFVKLGELFLNEMESQILLFATPEQKNQLPNVPQEHYQLITQDNLGIVASCLCECNLFIGNDSGLTHLAAAQHVPTLGIFGPSCEKGFAPWGAHTAWIRTPESMAELLNRRNKTESLLYNLTPEAVFEAAKKMLDASCSLNAL